MDDKADKKGGAAGRRVCPGCGRAFVCGMEAGHARCWCAELPHALAVPDPGPATGAVGCYCPDCLRARIAAASAGEQSASA